MTPPTPGKWEVQQGDGTWFVYGPPKVGGAWLLANVTEEANARIMAAAPDLLEALEGLIAGHEALYEPLAKLGLTEDPKYREPHIPDPAYIQFVDSFEHARDVVDTALARTRGGGPND